MISLKNYKEIEIMVEGGRKLARILEELAKNCVAGMSAKEIDNLAFKLFKKENTKPAFLNYKPQGATSPFPANICVSLNDVIVHGIPKKEIIFKEGDLVKIDAGLIYKNLYVDSAITIGIGQISYKAQKLIKVTKEALKRAIDQCVVGKTLGDIGYAISSYVFRNKMAVAEDLVGHGIGYHLHEDPVVYNIGQKGKGLKLEKGMALAIEPMVCLGNGAIIENNDESFSTLDKSLSAHFEHTVIITDDLPIITTNNNLWT